MRISDWSSDVCSSDLFYDELVEPAAPVPTAALDFQQDNPQVANILLQDVCPGRFVDHVTIGLTDRLAFELAVDAITHPGPANVDRVRDAAGGQTALCGALPIVPSQVIAPQIVTGLIDALRQAGIDSEIGRDNVCTPVTNDTLL